MILVTEKTQRKQKTLKGHEIPVPKRSDVLRDLRKVAKGGKRSTPDGADK
jgi:hypothetical protein